MAQPDVPHSRQPALDYFEDYVQQNHRGLAGQHVYDLSVGSGYIINLFREHGASVHPFDLFPEQNTFCPVRCEKIDLQKPFPIADAAADVVISSETIEHLPNQAFFFQEVARILKPGGVLLFTTPNTSSLRSRFAQFLGESEHYGSPLPNEHSAFIKWPGQQEGYFGKIFLSGILRLRVLAALQGLKIKCVVKTRSSSTSWLLMITYPLIYYFARQNYRKALRVHPEHAKALREIFELNTSTLVLLSKHLIVEFVKA